ncbi:DUF2280 domain-containing protein [Burkholderia vietnamiensis]|uniref:DUF2280 domain-containing protein n=1 Tax=Burkholderia vietnamiensis TaxID=60552 RepID=UPI000A68D3F7|nr:DUF2280 domain-containing protein [Burkholderia vietnamiensis]
MAALPDTIKVYIVQSLACFDTISRTAKAVRDEFDVEVSPQQCERYDPTKRGGATLSKKYREIFECTREKFLTDTPASACRTERCACVRSTAPSRRRSGATTCR